MPANQTFHFEQNVSGQAKLDLKSHNFSIFNLLLFFRSTASSVFDFNIFSFIMFLLIYLLF